MRFQPSFPSANALLLGTSAVTGSHSAKGVSCANAPPERRGLHRRPQRVKCTPSLPSGVLPSQAHLVRKFLTPLWVRRTAPVGPLGSFIRLPFPPHVCNLPNLVSVLRIDRLDQLPFPLDGACLPVNPPEPGVCIPSPPPQSRGRLSIEQRFGAAPTSDAGCCDTIPEARRESGKSKSSGRRSSPTEERRIE